MKQILRFWSVASGLLLVQLGGATAAWAEGSKQLTPNNAGTTTDLTSADNTRAGYLVHDSNSPNPVSQQFLKPGAPDEQRMYVRLKPGETLYYGVHRTPTGLLAGTTGNQNNVVITVRWLDAAGNPQSQAATLGTATGTNPNRVLLNTAQNGVIDDATQNQAGPKTANNPTGYDALSVTYPANQTGTRDYWVEFTQENEGSLGADALQSYYDFWDFTVKNASDQEQPGRLFSKFWAFTSGRSGGTQYENRLSATFSMFTLVPSPTAGQYYVKQVELAGMRPLNFFFVANAKGTDAASTDFTQSRKSVAGKAGYAEYLNFVNDPDLTLWPSAPVPLFSRTAQFFCSPINGSGSGAFTTLSGENGSVNVLIDLNNNNVQDGNDVLLTQTVQANVPATVRWDGKDKNGTTVAPGPNVKINLSFTSTGTPVNYPLYDAEGNDDGLRIQNVRPSSGGNVYFDRLYWDDTNLSTTLFPDNGSTPENERVRLNGADSTPGVHKWGNATNDVGNNVTLNTWTYGFITPIDQIYTYTFTCDYDNDGVADAADLDDDNDGVLDLTETYGVNPQESGPSNVLIYLDAAYVHPSLGAYRDLNQDGINDIFDLDRDGLPNHFDLDADGDGLTDTFEANGNAVFTATRGAAGPAQSRYDATLAKFVGNVGANGIPNAAETGNDSGTLRNSLIQDADRDYDKELRTVGSNTATSYNFLDIDSDNDGITDEIEALTTAIYDVRKTQANFNTDANKNGLRDAYDPANGGVAIETVENSDTDNRDDLFDFDSDGDNTGKTNLSVARQTADWSEGFDANGNGVAGDEILAKARLFAVNNPAKASYYTVSTNSFGGGGTTFSVFLQDADNDEVPNFLDVDSPSYHDDNFNGLVDIYDPAYGGAPSIAPKAAGSTTLAAFRTNTAQVPLPVVLTDFRAQAAKADVVLTWQTAQEINNHHFEVERSLDGRVFEKVATLEGQGTVSRETSYQHVDAGAALLKTDVLYYRLRQVDTNGQGHLSPIRSVSLLSAANAGLFVYPNPSTGTATLDLSALPAGAYSVQILDVTGRVLQQHRYQPGHQPLDLRALPAGTYFVKVQGTGTTVVLPLLRQ